MLEPYVIPLGLFAALILVIIILYVTVWLYKKTDRVYSLTDLIREGGYPSLARFQFTLWTLIVVFCFTSICVIRFMSGALDVPEQIPENLLALMGISAGVTAVSTGVSKNKYADETKKRDKKEYLDFIKDKKLGSMLLENEEPSITRFQMLAWTFLSVFLYAGKFLATIFQITDPNALVLPDIEFTLLVLMGVSQGAYLGGKWVAPTKMEIFSATSNKIGDKDYIVLNGANLGDDTQMIVYDDTVIPQNQINWSNQLISFEVEKLDLTKEHTVILKIGAKQLVHKFQLKPKEEQPTE